MAFLGSRNPRLDPRFDEVATAYMRHGEALSIRWDYAFFQMILETGNLSFQRGNGVPGSVKPSQNNFAGLGATSRKVAGEAFPDIQTGVKAHLQHLLMYAGVYIDNPVAERTRKVQSWGILTKWQRRFRRPITFSDLAAKWAPGSRRYAGHIQSVANRFYSTACRQPDPRPHLVAEARGTNIASSRRTARPAPSAGDQLARKAIERGRVEGVANRFGLGARTLTGLSSPRNGSRRATINRNTTGLIVLNPSKSSRSNSAAAEQAAPKAGASADRPAAGANSSRKAKVHLASAATAAAAAVKPKQQPEKTKCRVWTASYGGQKAVIIRAVAKGMINYTVLDVNEGQERRETEAYIAAYAKNGKKIADFGSQNAALDRAFKLCPEG